MNKKSKADPRPNKNIGRVQHAGKNWRDSGSEQNGDRPYHQGPEAYERAEREAYNRPFYAAYRYLIGPAPSLLPGDTTGARAYLSRIESAIEQGGWTRSEARRLRKLRDKWKARATGTDARFKEVGNRRGGLTQVETANVRTRKIMAEMQSMLQGAFKSEGD